MVPANWIFPRSSAGSGHPLPSTGIHGQDKDGPHIEQTFSKPAFAPWFPAAWAFKVTWYLWIELFFGLLDTEITVPFFPPLLHFFICLAPLFWYVLCSSMLLTGIISLLDWLFSLKWKRAPDRWFSETTNSAPQYLYRNFEKIAPFLKAKRALALDLTLIPSKPLFKSPQLVEKHWSDLLEMRSVLGMKKAATLWFPKPTG